MSGKVGDKISADEVREGDWVTATFEKPFCGTGGRHAITGMVVRGVSGMKLIADRVLHHAESIVRAEPIPEPRPAWKDALVIKAGGKVISFVSTGKRPWASVPFETWYSDDEIAALGPVTILVDADGNAVQER